MLTYSERDVRRANWYGLKSLAAAGMTLPIANPAIRFIGKHALPKHLAYRLPVSAKSASYQPIRAEPLTLLDPKRDQIAKDIYWGNGQPTSPADARVLRLVETLCEEAATFLDVGSYGALFAMLAAKANPNLRSIAYEIVPENFILMQRNIIANDLIGRVEAKLLGLGSEPGELTMPAVSLSVSNDSSISIGSHFSNGVRVPISTLDDDALDCTGPIVMKIDVEGFEPQVFAGGANFFRKHRPDIICEFLPGATGVAEIQDLLLPLGYRLYLSRPNGFEKRDGLRPTSEGRDWVLSVREDLTEKMDKAG